MKKLISLLLLTISISAISQQTYVPDDNFEAWLELNSLGNGIPNDDSVTTSNISGLSDLIVPSQGIIDITGIEDFTSITILILDFNPVIIADLSLNLALTDANFNGCALTSINVSQNSQLENLICSSNNLSSLDISNNLLLKGLICNNNNLTTLDVTQNTALISFFCGQNSITSLDLSQNTALTQLSVTSNPLTSLDITQNTALIELSCVQNTLTLLNVSQNTALTTIDCRSNSLTELDVSQNTALEALFCRANLITSLDLSSNLNLNNLNCMLNDLYCLNVNNQNSFEDAVNLGSYNFACSANPNLSCIEVTNPGIASSNYNADATATFNFSCLPVVDANVTQSGTQLTADLALATYQWVDCNDNFSNVSGATNQSFTPTTTGNYAVYVTVSDECGSTNTELSGCFYIDYTDLEELVNSEKELVKIVDFTGRETAFKSNVPLIFIYSDGSRERVMEIQK